MGFVTGTATLTVSHPETFHQLADTWNASQCAACLSSSTAQNSWRAPGQLPAIGTDSRSVATCLARSRPSSP